jgi:uncharacterized protein YoxC
MEQLINVCVNNGLGVCSFIALLIFIFKYQDKANKTLEEISATLIKLSERITKLENRKSDKDE